MTLMNTALYIIKKISWALYQLLSYHITDELFESLTYSASKNIVTRLQLTQISCLSQK